VWYPKTYQVCIVLVFEMIRVLILSPTASVRQGLKALCQTAADIEVMETAVDTLPPEETPHIILIDGQDMAASLQQIRQLKTQFPHTHTILLVDRLDGRTIWAAARAGVDRCLRKGGSAHNLLQLIRRKRY
jgi:DNA-binding NarL/FixJ family response regulator